MCELRCIKLVGQRVRWVDALVSGLFCVMICQWYYGLIVGPQQPPRKQQATCGGLNVPFFSFHIFDGEIF